MGGVSWSAKPGARVVLIGILADDRTASLLRPAGKGLTIKLTRRMKPVYPRAIRLVESDLVDVRSLVTYRFPLEEFDKAFSIAQRRKGLKVIIEP